MRKFQRERFKTTFLTMLFILSIALNQQLWLRISLTKITSAIRQTEKIEERNNIDVKGNIYDIISPQSFSINFGGGLHTRLYTDSYGMWNQTLKLLKSMYEKEHVVVKKADKKKWLEVREFRSIEMKFGDSIPMDILGDIIDQKEIGNIEAIKSIDHILISLSDGIAIYVADKEKDTYYSIKGNNVESNLYTIVKNIEHSKYDEYRDFRDIYGINNNTKIPRRLNDTIHEIEVVKEIDPERNIQVEAFAGTFFGENLDFVRKITETNGSVIHMYGYGQKILKINHQGALQYTEKIDERKAQKDIKIEDAMKIAVQFIREHGGWSNIDGYLKDIKYVENEGKKTYKFSFGYRINGVPVYYSDENGITDTAMEIEMLGEQVISYKRHLKREERGMKLLELIEKEMLSASQIIDANFETMSVDFLASKEDLAKREDEELVEEVLSGIQGVEIGYYNDFGEPAKLIPVWIIKTDIMTYYIDVYDGTIVSRSTR